MTPGGIGETLRTGQNLPIWRVNTNIPVEDILYMNT